MDEHRPVDPDRILAAVQDLTADRLRGPDGKSTSVLVVDGPPRSGKTTVAAQALLAGMEIFGDRDAFMAVSGRVAADMVSRRVILERESTGRTRPVGTLQALAFQVLSQAASFADARRSPLPRLLNGAEQDALLRHVMADHIEHVRVGDGCAVCRLLERYFHSESGWSSVLITQSDGQVEGVSNRFIAQLRDMFARMTELGVASGDRDQLLSALDAQPIDLDRKERLGLQWRLAFALNDEYLKCIDRTYPDEFRLDPSQLMVRAARGVERVAGLALPRFLVVDDWQDVTLAGMGFLQTLNRAGCRLLLVGNCDQSVQSFRGSYPEFLAARLTCLSAQTHGDAVPMLADDFACLNARRMVLKPRRIVAPRMDGREGGKAGGSGPDRSLAASICQPGGNTGVDMDTCQNPPMNPLEGGRHDGPGSYADLVAARISLGIASLEEDDRALPDRPGKLPAWPGAGPVAPLTHANPLLGDGSVTARLFHTPAQEEDDLVWQIKHEFLTQGRDWNDMAVIAHDNATIRALGRKLRAQGVPVRYSSVTRPLSEEPTIQGLFALVELARVVQDPSTLPAEENGPAAVASWVRRHLRTLMVSPLISAKVGEGGHERPVRMEHLESLMDSMAVLSRVRSSADSDPAGGETSSQGTDTTAAVADPTEETLSALPGLVAAWQDWARAIQTQETDTARQRGIKVDDSLISGAGKASASAAGLSVDALQTMLLLDPQDSSQTILAAMAAIAGGRMEDPDVHALRHALKVVTTTADRIAALPDSQPQYVLWEAWRSLGLADDWQRRALAATQEGEEVNDSLDALMRLFQYAAGSQRFRTLQTFMDQVRSMQIEADSLAHIGPIEHAVTLTTPAGAAALARVWPLVWLPAIQDGVWPNLTPRDTMFGAEDLADLVLHNCIGEPDRSSFSHDPRLQSILYAEKKGFLEAVTRAGEQVRVSAVWNDDMVPSDFLYGYLPECYERTSDMAQADFTQVGAGAEESREYGGLEVSPRGLTAAARSLLARQALREDGVDQARVDDAVDTLRLLSKEGLQEADPRCWPFLYADFGAEEHADQSGSGQTGAVWSGPDQSETGPSPSAGSADQGPDLLDAGPGGRDHAVADASGSGLPVSKIMEVGMSGPTIGKSPDQKPEAPNQVGSQAVPLSPSAVDRIWQCPLEWVLNYRYSGPQPSRVATDFGSLIHRVAQEGTNRGLDKPDQGVLGQDARSLTDRQARASAELLDIYHEFARNPPDGRDPKGLYDIHSREHQVEGIIDNLASYFVYGSTDGYGCGGSKPVPVGSLEGVQSERSFNAIITMDGLCRVWGATFPDRPLSREQFFNLLSGLVGGFPEALTPATAVRLTGRIDRLESRCIDGRHYLRLVDYKTGRVHDGRQLFNDLQLVCYQLGLAFQTCEERDPACAEAGWSLPGAPDPGQFGGLPVSQSILFDVAKPAKDPDRGIRPEEARYQPPIFHNGAFTSNYLARTGLPDPSKLADLEDLPVESPQGVDQEVWDMVRNHTGGAQIVWGLTMVARVFFAAGVRLSASLPDALFDPSRCHNRSRDGVCPAWERLAPNILEDQE